MSTDHLPRPVVTVVGRILGCPRCGRTRIQHGRFSCAELDGIRARVEFGKLGRLRRLFTRTPAGWNR